MSYDLKFENKYPSDLMPHQTGIHYVRVHSHLFNSSLDWLLTCSIWCNTEGTLRDHLHERERVRSVNTFVVIVCVIAWLASTCSIWCSNKKDSSVYTFAVNFVVVKDMNSSKNSCSIISLRPCPFGTVGGYPYWVNLVFIDAGSHLHRTV